VSIDTLAASALFDGQEAECGDAATTELRRLLIALQVRAPDSISFITISFPSHCHLIAISSPSNYERMAPPPPNYERMAPPP
jgi:hypothetical protein